jgi:protease IV
MDENTTPPPPVAPPPYTAAPAPPPPPANPPPPLIAPTGTPMPRRGRGWMTFAIILLILLAISALFNLGHLFSGLGSRGKVKYSRSVGPKLEEVTAEDNDAADKIALIDVDGIISSRAIDSTGYGLVELIKAQLKRAEEDKTVKAVILKVDSPGGEVLASDEINREITDFQKRTRPSKPVIASMGNLAASGGYYISVPCQWIVANELTITGSIGVIMHSYNYRGLMDKVGLRPETYKSGKFKDMLSGDRSPDQILPEEKAMIQRLIDETYGRFKTVVAEGRKQAFEKNKSRSDKGRELAGDWADYADGRVLSGKEAYNLGFVDELGNFQDAVKRAKKMAGVSGEVNLIQYQPRYDLADIFRLFGKSEGKTTLKVDLGIDPPKLQMGQLYFLAPTFVH